MLSELVGAFSATKTSVDLLRAALGLKISHEVALALVDVTNKLLALQGVALGLSGEVARQAQALDAAAQRERLLKEEAGQQRQFQAEQQAYALHQVAPGAFAYVKTAADGALAGGPQAEQWFCTQCFEEHRKSILQYAGYEAAERVFKCPRCGGAIRVKGESAEVRVVSGRGRRDRD